MIRFVFAVLWLAVSFAGAAPLDPLVSDPGLWAMKPADFEKAAKGLGFRWVSQTRDSARAAGGDLTVFGLPTVETIARFDGEKMKELTVVIYARGDAGGLTKEAYDALVRSAVETLNRSTKVKFAVRGKDPTNVVRADGLTWTTTQTHYLLEYSATREVKSRDIAFRAEFVRLEMTPPPRTPSLLSAATSAPGRTKFIGTEHVQRDPATGDVWIGDVPMVDQGMKGYCVVAAAERVVRYYGKQVDANELAQIANSDAAEGTSNDGMFAALKKVGTRLKVRVRQIEAIDVKGVLELIKDYNRAAKKANAPAVADPGGFIEVGEIYRQMQLPVLREARTRDRAAFGRFQRDVQQHIDQGTPLLWSVQLGKVAEPGIPQNAGGHMRLIIGYNTKTAELIFSDTWGAGHEKKRMSMEDGWAITTGSASIEPL